MRWLIRTRFEKGSQAEEGKGNRHPSSYRDRSLCYEEGEILGSLNAWIGKEAKEKVSEKNCWKKAAKRKEELPLY